MHFCLLNAAVQWSKCSWRGWPTKSWSGAVLFFFLSGPVYCFLRLLLCTSQAPLLCINTPKRGIVVQFLGFRSAEGRAGKKLPWQKILFTQDNLTCNSNKSTAVIYNINNGSVIFEYPSEPWQCVSMHNSRALKLKRLHGIQPSYV